jgi:PmbA protein
MKKLDLDLIQTELLTLSDLAVKKALQKGANEAEALFSAADTMSVIIRKKTIDARRGMPSGGGIRVVIEGKVGFAAATGTNKKLVDNVVEEAIAVARIRPADPNFKHLPDPVQLVSRDGIIDSGILEFSEDSALTSVGEFAKRAQAYDKRIKSFYGNLSVNRACLAVSNSRGIEGSSKTAYMKVSARCTAADEGRQKTGTDIFVTRKLNDFSELGEKAAISSLRMLESKPLGRTMKSCVIWEAMPFGGLFKEMLGSAIDAENVIEGRSYLKDKIGENVASRNTTIVDDGQLPEGIETSKIDGEGIPRRTTTLIDSGVLKTYLYDSYSSLIQDKESTGNATREWPEPFLQSPSTSTTNLVVKPGTKKLDELLGEVDEGVLVTDDVMGAGTSNLITGDFSIVAPNSYLVKKGQIVHPLEPVSVAGNFFEALKTIREIGSDARLLDEGRIPSIVIEDLSVSG